MDGGGHKCKSERLTDAEIVVVIMHMREQWTPTCIALLQKFDDNKKYSLLNAAGTA